MQWMTFGLSWVKFCLVLLLHCSSYFQVWCFLAPWTLLSSSSSLSHPPSSSFSILPPSLHTSSSSYSCSELPLAWTSVCVLDSAFLDDNVCECRETPRALAGPPVSRCFFGVWQLSAFAWLSFLLLTGSALSSVFLHYCTPFKKRKPPVVCNTGVAARQEHKNRVAPLFDWRLWHILLSLLLIREFILNGLVLLSNTNSSL